jgi:hypothetical protein
MNSNFITLIICPLPMPFRTVDEGAKVRKSDLLLLIQQLARSLENLSSFVLFD